MRCEKEKEAASAPPNSSSVTVKVRCASETKEDVFAPDSPTTYNRTSSGNQRSSVTSVTSLEASQVEGSARRSSAMRLPPLSHASSHMYSGTYDRESSGESVTSAGKVTVDVKRSPGVGRNRRVGDIAS